MNEKTSKWGKERKGKERRKQEKGKTNKEKKKEFHRHPILGVISCKKDIKKGGVVFYVYQGNRNKRNLINDFVIRKKERKKERKKRKKERKKRP